MNVPRSYIIDTIDITNMLAEASSRRGLQCAVASRYSSNPIAGWLADVLPPFAVAERHYLPLGLWPFREPIPHQLSGFAPARLT